MDYLTMAYQARFYYRHRSDPAPRHVCVDGLGIHEDMPPGVISHGGAGAPYLLIHFHSPAQLAVDGEMVDAQGRFAIWDAGAYHRYGNQGARWDHSWINVSGSAVSEAVTRERLPLGRPLEGLDQGITERYLGLLHAELHDRHPPDGTVVAGLLALYLREVVLAQWGATDPDPDAERLFAARRTMVEQLDRAWSLEEVADLAALSVSQFSLRFRRRFGLSPMRYLGEQRMAAAQRLLEQTGLTVQQVAWRVGFPDPLYFSRQFRRHAGLSPSAYRQRGG
ncbi:MAG: AraC family transcriptional regulator [Planctomycetota bacterium]|nr:AraC family transcriptional regulator [Planctomycetota bacterium]